MKYLTTLIIVAIASIATAQDHNNELDKQAPGADARSPCEDTTSCTEWIDVPFSAGNFTGFVGTWAVQSGDVTENRYKIIGKTMYWNMVLGGTSTAGLTRSLITTIPALHKSKANWGPPAGYSVGVVLTPRETMIGFLSPGADRIGWSPVTTTPIPNENNTLTLSFLAVFEIQ